MAMSLGYRWSSSFGDALDERGELTETAQHWLNKLGSLTVERVAVGIDKAEQMPGDWWPSLQGFKELCDLRPEDLGIPDAEVAYISACKKEWLHPVVWRAAQEVGVYDLTARPESLMKNKFMRVYKGLVNRALWGEKFEITKTDGPALDYDRPATVTSHGDPSVHLAKMRELLGKER